MKKFVLKLVDRCDPLAYDPYEDQEFLAASFRLLWRHAPDWTRFAAQDQDHHWHWFEHQPIANLETGKWESPSHYSWSRRKPITISNYDLGDHLAWHRQLIAITDDPDHNHDDDSDIIDLYPQQPVDH